MNFNIFIKNFITLIKRKFFNWRKIFIPQSVSTRKKRCLSHENKIGNIELEKSGFFRKIIRIKRQTKLLIELVFIGILGVLICGSFLCYTKKTITEKSLELLKYNVKSVITPEFKVKENDLFEKDIIKNKGGYIWDTIESMISKIKIIYDGSNEAKVNIKYDVDAKVIGSLENIKDNNLWEKEIKLLDLKESESIEKGIKINDEFETNINQWNELVEKTTKKYSIRFESKLEISYNINLKIQYINQTKFENLRNILSISLGDKYFKIDGDYEQEKKSSIINKERKEKFMYRYLIKYLIFLFSVFIILFILFEKTVRVIETKNNEIQNISDKINTSYEERIVTLKNKVDTEKYLHIEMKSIVDLIKISDDFEKPILYFEEENYYFILDENICYKFQIALC